MDYFIDCGLLVVPGVVELVGPARLVENFTDLESAVAEGVFPVPEHQPIVDIGETLIAELLVKLRERLLFLIFMTMVKFIDFLMSPRLSRQRTVFIPRVVVLFKKPLRCTRCSRTSSSKKSKSPSPTGTARPASRSATRSTRRVPWFDC